MSDDLFEGEEFVDYAPERGQVEASGEKNIKLKTATSNRELQVRQPLADRLRPYSFESYAGQKHLVGDGAPLRKLIEADRVPSMIFQGPPGTGKTTLAGLIAKKTDSDFIVLSAVTAGIKDVRNVISTAKVNRQYARRTILFVDEIHRFNKSQQDAFLPHVEGGLITLIGATTENPSFTVNAALLSRCRVFTLESLAFDDIKTVLDRGVEDFQEYVGDKIRIVLPEESSRAIFYLCDGDARRALTILESCCHVMIHETKEQTEEKGSEELKGDGAEEEAGMDSESDDSVPPDTEAIEALINPDLIKTIAQQQLLYDRDGEEHYNLISALHKTIRSSDPHGATYWANRMLRGGEDPRYLIRRMIRMAGEDIGLADPRAIEQAVACQKAFETLGSPEGDLFITQLAIYLALAPKSNAVYRAHNNTRKAIDDTGTLPVPNHLRNAPTKLMKEQGYSDGYTYDHDAPDHFIAKQGLPDDLEGTELYKPANQGSEKKITERLNHFDEARRKEKNERKN